MRAVIRVCSDLNGSGPTHVVRDCPTRHLDIKFNIVEINILPAVIVTYPQFDQPVCIGGNIVTGLLPISVTTATSRHSCDYCICASVHQGEDSIPTPCVIGSPMPSQA